MDHEQRINMKFCFKLQKSAKETYEMSKLVYGDVAVTMKMVYKWFKQFCNGCESVEDGGDRDVLQHQKHKRMLKE